MSEFKRRVKQICPKCKSDNTASIMNNEYSCFYCGNKFIKPMRIPEDLKTGMMCITGDGECRIVWGQTIVGLNPFGGITFAMLENPTENNRVIKVYSEPYNKDEGLSGGIDYWLEGGEDCEAIKFSSLLFEQVEN